MNYPLPLFVLQSSILFGLFYSKTSVLGACSNTGILSAATGNISDSYYQSSDVCDWIIAVPGATITLTFTSFDTEANNDILHAYSCTSSDCSSGLSELRGSPFSGFNIPSPMISTTGYMRVTFISDSSNNYPGFIATYSTSTATCPGSGSILTTTSGTISGGPGNYAANANCSWIIAVPGTPIKLTFTSLQIDGINNRVQVYSCLSSACSSATELPGSPFSGPSLPNPLPSTTGYMRVTFSSDSSYVSSGFTATYSTGSNCEGSGSILSDSSDVISYSPITSWTACNWIIAAPNTKITLAFDALDIDTNHDMLWIYSCESLKCVSPSLLQGNPFSGPNLPGPVYSFTGYMMIGFTSDGFSTYPEFRLTYFTSSSTALRSQISIPLPFPGMMTTANAYCNKYSFIAQGGLCAGFQVDRSSCSTSPRDMDAAQSSISSLTKQTCLQEANSLCLLLSGSVRPNACDNGETFCKIVTQSQSCQTDSDCSRENLSSSSLPCCVVGEIFSLCDNIDSSKVETLTSALEDLGQCNNDNISSCPATNDQDPLSIWQTGILITMLILLSIMIVSTAAWNLREIWLQKSGTSAITPLSIELPMMDSDIHNTTGDQTVDGNGNLSRIIDHQGQFFSRTGGSRSDGDYETSDLHHFRATAPYMA